MMTRRQILIRLLPAVIFMILIFIQSAMPGDVSEAESEWVAYLLTGRHYELSQAELTIWLIRKTAHFGEYLLLGLGLRWALKSSALAWIIGAAYAVSDELHQLFVPGRSCEVLDVCIDAAGVLVGVLIMAFLRKHFEKKKKNKTA